jgi:8-oxo-dGTP pyrophosphatase MutT (NUDIX family)
VRTLYRWFYKINRLRWRVTRPVTVGVRLILLQDQTVLLVKHTYQPHWYLPGGGVKRSETLKEAAQREASEELGAELGELDLFGVYTNFYEYKNDHVIVFSCNDFTLTGKTDHEIERFDFFKLNDLPEDTSPGSQRRIQEYANSNRSPIVGTW